MNEWVAGVAAVITAVVLAVQVRLITVQARQDRVAIANRIAQRWNQLQEDWQLAVMVVRGPMSYYPAVDPGTRVKYRDARAAYIAAHDRSERALILNKKLLEVVAEGAERKQTEQAWTNDYVERLETELWKNLMAWLPIDSEVILSRAAVQVFRMSLRRILGFLSEVAGQILRGELQPELAYETLGPQVARNSGTIRRMMEDQAEWVSFQPGLQLRVLAIIDLMWAEGSRIGELDTQPTAAQVAKHKRETGSGKESRKRTAQLVRRISHKPRLLREWKVLQLNNLLRHAEKPTETFAAHLKYEVFKPRTREGPDLDWSLEGKQDDIRVAWLQTALISAASGNERIVPIIEVLSHLIELREANPDSFRWWDPVSEEE